MTIKRCSICWETGSVHYDVIDEFNDCEPDFQMVCHSARDGLTHYTELYFNNMHFDEASTICKERAIEYINMQISVLNDCKAILNGTKND